MEIVKSIKLQFEEKIKEGNVIPAAGDLIMSYAKACVLISRTGIQNARLPRCGSDGENNLGI
jgi:hypothetical protein